MSAAIFIVTVSCVALNAFALGFTVRGMFK